MAGSIWVMGVWHLLDAISISWHRFDFLVAVFVIVVIAEVFGKSKAFSF